MRGLHTSDLEVLTAKHGFYQREAAAVEREGAAARIEDILGEIHNELDRGARMRFWELWKDDLALDSLWAHFDEVRALFCRGLPVSRLLGWVIEDINQDTDQLLPGDARMAQATLASLRVGFGDLGASRRSSDPEPGLRASLENISYQTARARESLWVRVNLKRSRLQNTGLILGLVLVAGLVALVGYSGAGSGSPVLYPGVALAGAAGGLVSSLLDREPYTGATVDFYINHVLLLLRPLVGAAVALASVFALEAGVFTVFSINASNASVPGLLIVAFITGFSQRIFVNGVIDPLAGGGRRERSEASGSQL